MRGPHFNQFLIDISANNIYFLATVQPSYDMKCEEKLIMKTENFEKTEIFDKYLEIQPYVRVHSDRMLCDFFAANNRMRFTHASTKINATHVIQ